MGSVTNTKQRIEILPPVTTKQKMAIPPPPKSPGGSSSLVTSKASNSTQPQPAFNGAKFDIKGFCLSHPSVQLANPMKDDDGKLIYQELKMSCPTCQSIKYKAKKSTSLGGGKVRSGHRVHGAPPTSSSSNGQQGSGRSRSKSRERGSSERGRDKSLSRSQSGRSASKSRERSSSNNNSNNSKPQRHKHEYDTPFDSKGRCHYHKNVQLAAKKMTGGWKMLHSSCPKCMEDSFETPSRSTSRGISRGSSSGSAARGGDAGDDRSVRSSSSRRGGGAGGGEHANGQFDKNGCCVLHTHIQVAKKSVFGKFKVVRACPACDGHDVGNDDISVSSKKSTRSNSSRKSTRSAKSSASRGKPGKASKSGRYGALPFDADGYCCRHPNIQLAKKKTLGGFKIIHAECPECMADDTGSRSSRRSKSSSGRRRKSNGTGRVFDDSGSETSSYKSGKSTGSKPGRKKRIRVRNLKTEDEEGKIGRYSGDVNDEHVPHGNGVMKYVDGSIFDGVWNEGSKVHGKTKSSTGGVGSSDKKKDGKAKA